MSDSEILPVSWSCLWCKDRFEFELRLGVATSLVKREAICPSCEARIGLELLHASDGTKLHYKRVAPGRAGRLEIVQIEDALTVSLAGRPLASGDELDLRRDGAWHRAVFAWDPSGEGHASVSIRSTSGDSEERIDLDSGQDLLRWLT